MSRWSQANPESDIDQWADSMREEADQRRKEMREKPSRNGNGGLSSQDRRKPTLGQSNYSAAALRREKRKKS